MVLINKKVIISVSLSSIIFLFILGCASTGPVNKLESDKLDIKNGYTSIICMKIKAEKSDVYTLDKPYILLCELSDDNVKLLEKDRDAKITVSYARRVFASKKWENGRFNETIYLTVKPGNYLFLGTSFTQGDAVGPTRKIIKVPANMFVYLGSIMFKLSSGEPLSKYKVDFKVENNKESLKKSLKQFTTKYPKLSDQFKMKISSSTALLLR